MKKIYKFNFLILFWLFIAGFFSFAHAYDLKVSCDSNSCAQTSSSPLFPSSVIWYPGKSVGKLVRIENLTSSSQKAAVKAVNFTDAQNIASIFNLSIIKLKSGLSVFEGSLFDFAKSGEINLDTLNANASEDFDFTIKVSQDAGNAYQNKNLSFNLSLGFLETSLTPTSGSSANPSVSPNPTLKPTDKPAGKPIIEEILDNRQKEILGEKTKEVKDAFSGFLSGIINLAVKLFNFILSILSSVFKIFRF